MEEKEEEKEEFDSTLWEAAGGGDVERLQHALETHGRWIEVAHPTRSRMTCIHRAARSGCLAALNLLIQSGSKAIDTPDVNGRTAMHVAAAMGHLEVVQGLIELGSMAVDLPDNDGRTPMHLGCGVNGGLRAVEVLLRYTPHSQPPNHHHEDDKEDDESERKKKWVMEMISRRDKLGRTCMHAAAWKGDVGVISKLVEVGGRSVVDVVDDEGRTPLQLAAINGHATCIHTLIRSGCPPLSSNNNNKEGWTAMHIMAQFGHARAIELTVQMQTKEQGEWMELGTMDSVDELGRTPMHHVAAHGHASVMESLIGMGSTAMRMHDQHGCTPMHVAVTAGHVHVVAAIVRLVRDSLDGVGVSAGSAAGCSIHQHHPPPNHSPPGTSTSTSSSTATSPRTRGQLSARAAKAMDMGDMDGRTPIRSAVDGGHVSVIRTLVGLGSGALDTPDNHGHPPMYSAVINESAACVDVLRSLGASFKCVLPQSRSMLVEWIDSDSALLGHIPSDALEDLGGDLDDGARNGLKLLVSGGGRGMPVDGVLDLLKSLQRRPLNKHGVRLLSLLVSSSSGLDLRSMKIGDAGCTTIADSSSTPPSPP